MYILYADESGNRKKSDQTFFILAGVSCFERQTFWLAQEIDKIAERIYPADPNELEFHGNHMQVGKGFWRGRPKEERFAIIEEILRVLVDSHQSNRVFACVIDKKKASPNNPVELAFEHLASRFDKYLMRQHALGDPQRGVIVFDKSSVEETIQSLAREFRSVGHTWGVLRNFAEVPLFLDSKASRLIQLADIIAYACFRHYEHGESRYFDIL